MFLFCLAPSLSCKEANRLGVFLTMYEKQNLRISNSKIIKNRTKLDGEYVKRFNFWFDCYVVIKTALQAFTGKNEKEGK